MIDQISNAIHQNGFTIVACLGLAWYSWKLTTRYADDANKREERLDKKIEDMTQRIRKLEDRRADDAARYAERLERNVRALARIARGHRCMAEVSEDAIRRASADLEPHPHRPQQDDTETIGRKDHDHG